AAYKLTTNLTVEGGYLNLSGQRGNLSQRPEVDIYLQYSGAGASAHELATSSDGFIAVVVGEGVVDNSLINLVAADILVTLLETFNPFAESEKSSHLECAVILSTFADGYANLEEMAMQSDRMTLLGSGSVNLDSEEIKLNWITKPRKGFGLSASMITNPYISLGGTLANPRLDLKPLEAMTTTGIAVATGGLSILAKGLYDRVTSERKVCKQAKQDGRKALEERGFTVQHRR
ncbi:MAG: hypothetical protein GY906_05215, partial [bacterium]|nr:hypothetical protein [bacterium]